MAATFVILLAAPLVAALACLWPPVRACQAVTIAAGVASFAAVIVLVPAAAHHDVTLGRYVRADAISVVFLLATSFLYATVSAYSVGYFAGDASSADFGRYQKSAEYTGPQAGGEAPSRHVIWTSAPGGSKVTAVRYRRAGGNVPARGKSLWSGCKTRVRPRRSAAKQEAAEVPHARHRLNPQPSGWGARQARRFYVGLNLFAWSMLVAPLMSSLALLWIAIEVTTVISALLVAIEDTDRAVEAAWKYVLIASAGLGLALLATIFMYAAGAHILGQSYDLTFAELLRAGPHLPHTVVRLAYGLAVLGFGTKVGLFPVHTWLPDAHAEAPTPVSALLSGSLLAVSFYAILRYYQVSVAALGPRFPQGVLLAFGIGSLLLAALYLFNQGDVKRLLAYSSMEHMGILAIGVSFGAPIALAGVLLHVLAHAAAKGNAFMGAGVLVRKYQTKRIARIDGALDLLPWSGPLLLTTVLALSAMPPFGIFRSEFQIVAGGFAAPRNAAAALLIVAVTVAFLGLSLSANRMLLNSPAKRLPRGEPSAWMVVPVVAGVAALVLLGVHPPAHLTELLVRGAAELRGLR